MRKSLLISLVTIGFAASACGKITIKVNKDAKNSTLEGAANSSTATDNFSLANPQDFLKHIDDLRTTAADILIKKLASTDYVGKFRSGVRNYRKFLIAKAEKNVVLSDSFYSDPSKECRDSGLSLNIDKDNEVLGLILETAILAKIGETNVGKINSGLSKEMQALSQFITMELGVDIQGTSSADKEGDVDITTGQVTIKLKPIHGEAIDDETKAADEKQVMTLKFERRLGKDQVGSFHGDISLVNTDDKIAQAIFDISRAKENDHYKHVGTVTIGMKGQTPGYARQIIVSDTPGQKTKFSFTDVLNAGSVNETVNHTVIDIEKGTQCKISGDEPMPGTTGGDTGGKTTGDSTTGTTGGTTGSTGGSTGSTTGSTTGGPSQTPNQSPNQSPTKK